MEDANGTVILEHVADEKDLGIRFQENLSFDEHTHNGIKKANFMVGLIRRVFTFLDAASFRFLYTALVRSLLESNQVVWFPARPALVD